MIRLNSVNRAEFSSVGFINDHTTTEIFKSKTNVLYRLGEDNYLYPYYGDYMKFSVPQNPYPDRHRGVK